MIKKTIGYSLIAASLLSFYGCGSSSSSSNTIASDVNDTIPSDTNNSTSSDAPVETKNYLTVVDGYVVGAQVKDVKGVIIGKTNTDGKIEVSSLETLAYPLYATGGYIDVNKNFYQDSGDIVIEDGVVFSADKGNVISPLTTLANSVDKASLMKAMGLNSIDELYADPIATNNLELEKANQIAYAIIATKKIQSFVYNLTTATNPSDLPNMTGDTVATIGSGSFDAFGQIAMNSVSANTKNFISEVISYSDSVNDIESDLQITKKELKLEIAQSTPTTTVTSEAPTTTSNTTTTTIASSSSSIPSSNGTSQLPNFGNPSITNPVPPVVPSDLPNLNNSTSISSVSSTSATSSTSSVPFNGSDLPPFGH